MIIDDSDWTKCVKSSSCKIMKSIIKIFKADDTRIPHEQLQN
jgi:hypothetical protein